MATSDYNAALKAAEATPIDEDRYYVASNGLRLVIKKVPLFLLRDAFLRLQEPKPPTIFIQEKGRSEENPSDPEYLLARSEYTNKMGSLGADILIMSGVTVDSVPDDLEKPEDEGWAEIVTDILGEGAIPEKGLRRRLAWLKYYALPGGELQELAMKVARVSGATMEADVSVALDSFRDGETRDTAAGVHPADAPRNGADAATGPNGEGAAIRGERGGQILSYNPNAVGGPPLV
jgi:hypothetical protein